MVARKLESQEANRSSGVLEHSVNNNGRSGRPPHLKPTDAQQILECYASVEVRSNRRARSLVATLGRETGRPQVTVTGSLRISIGADYSGLLRPLHLLGDVMTSRQSYSLVIADRSRSVRSGRTI